MKNYFMILAIVSILYLFGGCSVFLFNTRLLGGYLTIHNDYTNIPAIMLDGDNSPYLFSATNTEYTGLTPDMTATLLLPAGEHTIQFIVYEDDPLTYDVHERKIYTYNITIESSKTNYITILHGETNP